MHEPFSRHSRLMLCLIIGWCIGKRDQIDGSNPHFSFDYAVGGHTVTGFGITPVRTPLSQVVELSAHAILWRGACRIFGETHFGLFQVSFLPLLPYMNHNRARKKSRISHFGISEYLLQICSKLLK
jgi:hypothetical protein